MTFKKCRGLPSMPGSDRMRCTSTSGSAAGGCWLLSLPWGVAWSSGAASAGDDVAGLL